MFARFRLLLTRHPLVRDALVWALPALALGAVLRALLLHYMPCAYWGSDSKSYFSFAHQLLDRGYISLDEKRRYFYPVFMALVSLLPGATLKWLAWIQHALGLATIVPLAYVVRREFTAWRLWIVPLTIAFAGMPVLLWYEHELLGEAVFCHALVWAMAAWVAWVRAERPARARVLWWWFFTALAIFLLTKPSGRFVVPGIVCGLVLARAWSRLGWREWAAVAALFAATLTVGSKKQAAWLLYVSAFPLTQTDSPLHAEYKAQIRDMVEPLRRDIDTYYLHDDEPFAFLENPGKQDARPLWKPLQSDEKKRSSLYFDLALEGISAEPAAFLSLAAQRLIASANVSEFKLDRFEPGYFPGRLTHHYEEAGELLAKNKPTPIPMAFGLPKRGPLPPYEQFRTRLSREGWSARAVMRWCEKYAALSDLVHMPGRDAPSRAISAARPTILGGLLLAGLALALALPRWWRTLGVWALVALAYTGGVFLASQANPRYFLPAWPLLLVLLAAPLDALAARFFHREEKA